MPASDSTTDMADLTKDRPEQVVALKQPQRPEGVELLRGVVSTIILRRRENVGDSR